MPEPFVTEPDVSPVRVGPRDSHEAGVWLSAHIYIRCSVYSDAADAVLIDVLEPLLVAGRQDGWLLTWFFVRYRDPASHLRLRMHVKQSETTVAAEALVAHIRDVAPDATIESWLPVGETVALSDAVSVGNGMDSDSLAALRSGSTRNEIVRLRWIPYERELGRYGGLSGIDIAERLFDASSSVVVHVLRTLRERPRSTRLGRALFISLAAMQVFCETREAVNQFAESYGSAYLLVLAGERQSLTGLERKFQSGFALQGAKLAAQVQRIWEALTEGDDHEPFDQFLATLRLERDALRTRQQHGLVDFHGQRCKDWSECVSRIVPSYVHMTNNRLGITIEEESYVAYLIRWSLGGSSDSRSNVFTDGT